MRRDGIDLSNKIVYCIYEGNAELEILDILLDNKALIFSKDDLLDNKFHKRVSGKMLSEKLKYKFDKPIVIVRILDSKSENLKLIKPYCEMYTDIINCYTCPEIEYLLILYHDDLKKYNKEGLKPSEFCKKYYDYSKNKDKAYFKSNYTVDEIILMLRKYHYQKKKHNLSIYSLVKDKRSS